MVVGPPNSRCSSGSIRLRTRLYSARYTWLLRFAPFHRRLRLAAFGPLPEACESGFEHIEQLLGPPDSETGDEDRLPIGSCVDSLVVDVRSGVSGTGMRMGVSVCRFKEEGVCLRRLINFREDDSTGRQRLPRRLPVSRLLLVLTRHYPVGGPHFQIRNGAFRYPRYVRRDHWRSAAWYPQGDGIGR